MKKEIQKPEVKRATATVKKVGKSERIGVTRVTTPKKPQGSSEKKKTQKQIKTVTTK